MTLYEGQVGGQYFVEDIGIEQGISRRLQEHGLPWESISPPVLL